MHAWTRLIMESRAVIRGHGEVASASRRIKMRRWSLFAFSCSWTHQGFLWRNSPTLARTASFFRFLDHTQWHATVGRTPLDEGSACRRDLYLTIHNTRKRQTSVPLAGFGPATTASELAQTIALDHSATEIGLIINWDKYYYVVLCTVVLCKCLPHYCYWVTTQ